MKSGIDFYGLLWVFVFCFICIVQLIALASTYKSTNEISSLIIEIIEVYDGYNSSAKGDIELLISDYDSVVLDIDRKSVSDKFVYFVKVSKELKIPILNLVFDIYSNKTSKGVLE